MAGVQRHVSTPATVSYLIINHLQTHCSSVRRIIKHLKTNAQILLDLFPDSSKRFFNSSRPIFRKDKRISESGFELFEKALAKLGKTPSAF